MKVCSHSSAFLCFTFKPTALREKRPVEQIQYMKCKTVQDSPIWIWKLRFCCFCSGSVDRMDQTQDWNMCTWGMKKVFYTCKRWNWGCKWVKIQNSDWCKVGKSCKKIVKKLSFLICLLFHCWYLIVKKSSICLLKPCMLGEYFPLSKENKSLKWNKVPWW